MVCGIYLERVESGRGRDRRTDPTASAEASSCRFDWSADSPPSATALSAGRWQGPRSLPKVSDYSHLYNPSSSSTNLPPLPTD